MTTNRDLFPGCLVLVIKSYQNPSNVGKVGECLEYVSDGGDFRDPIKGDNFLWLPNKPTEGVWVCIGDFQTKSASGWGVFLAQQLLPLGNKELLKVEDEKEKYIENYGV